MQKLPGKLFKILVGIILLTIGYVLGKHESFPIYYFRRDIDLVGIAIIITNVFIAWYIAKIIGKRNDIDKKDKEIVLNRLDVVISNLEGFITQVHSNNLNFVNVTSFIKRNGLSIERTCKNFSSYHNFDYSALSTVISKEMKNLLSLMTYTSPHSNIPIQEAVTISNNIITYTPARIDEILAKIDVIIDQVIKLQLLINSK